MRKREKHRCKRETSIGCLPYAPRPGIEPATFLVYRTMRQPAEPPSQGETVSSSDRQLTAVHVEDNSQMPMHYI